MVHKPKAELGDIRDEEKSNKLQHDENQDGARDAKHRPVESQTGEEEI